MDYSEKYLSPCQTEHTVFLHPVPRLLEHLWLCSDGSLWLRVDEGLTMEYHFTLNICSCLFRLHAFSQSTSSEDRLSETSAILLGCFGK